MMIDFEQRREKIADALMTIGAVVFIVVGIGFAIWAGFHGYGYIQEHGFEWKSVLQLFSKHHFFKFTTWFFCDYVWVALVFGIGWSMVVVGDIMSGMVPDQSKTHRTRAQWGIILELLGAVMCIVLLIVGNSPYFYVPFIFLMLGAYIGNTEKKKDETEK